MGKYYSLYDMQTGQISKRKNYESKRKILEDVFDMWFGSGGELLVDPTAYDSEEEYKKELEKEKGEVLEDIEKLEEFVKNIINYKVIEHDEKI
ncbi:MAG: hypothetical protein ACOCP8_06185 [archaeon]